MTAPAPIDHLPFYGLDLDRLAGAFQALGFTVSPLGAYVDPAGGGRWPNRSVFLRAGWFDLLEAPGASADAPYAPKACLFRSDDLAASTAAPAPVPVDPAYRLERRWRDAAPDAPPETFQIVNLRARIAPLPLALIAHAHPMGDVDPAWQAHANTAVAVGGVIFADAEAGPMATAAAPVVDLSVFTYMPASAFTQRFGAGPCAVVVRVASVDAASKALDRGGLTFTPDDGGLDVPAQGAFACGWRFEAAA